MNHFSKLFMNLKIIALLLFNILFSSGLFANSLPVYETIGGDFKAKSTLDRELNFYDLNGKVRLLFFGYVNCPDVCIINLAYINQSLKHIPNWENNVSVVFHTVDPQRDDLDAIKKYLAKFNNKFVGFRQDIKNTQVTAQKFGATFSSDHNHSNHKNYHPDSENKLKYDVAHTARIFLVDKRGLTRGFYDPGRLTTKEFAEIIQSLF